jgi:hypothetical protein
MADTILQRLSGASDLCVAIGLSRRRPPLRRDDDLRRSALRRARVERRLGIVFEAELDRLGHIPPGDLPRQVVIGRN